MSNKELLYKHLDDLLTGISAGAASVATIGVAPLEAHIRAVSADLRASLTDIAM
jgi:hypothetical protein